MVDTRANTHHVARYSGAAAGRDDWQPLGQPRTSTARLCPYNPAPSFTGFGVGSQEKKQPNRSAESKAKTAAKRSMQPKAVKVWEALKYHIEKGVPIMSDIDDIPGLHAYIAENEATKKVIMQMADLHRHELEKQRLELEIERKETNHQMELERKDRKMELERKQHALKTQDGQSHSSN